MSGTTVAVVAVVAVGVGVAATVMGMRAWAEWKKRREAAAAARARAIERWVWRGKVGAAGLVGVVVALLLLRRAVRNWRAANLPADTRVLPAATR